MVYDKIVLLVSLRATDKERGNLFRIRDCFAMLAMTFILTMTNMTGFVIDQSNN